MGVVWEPFQNPAVAEVFDSYPVAVQESLLSLRQLIFDTAKKTKGVGQIEETLKWGQPSYLTSESKSGTTIRIDQLKKQPDSIAIYVHCQTSLIEDFKEKYGESFTYEKTRALHFSATDDLPTKTIAEFFKSALTYRLNK